MITYRERERTYLYRKGKDMNAIMKAIKKYKIRRLYRKLKNEPVYPSCCIVTINEKGKKEIYMML